MNLKNYYLGKRVMITGGAGFLGSEIIKQLAGFDCEIIVPRKKNYDLTSQEDALACVRQSKPHVIIHAAAWYGGPPIHEAYPAKMFYENTMMGMNVMHASHLCDVEKVVIIGSDCAYPGYLGKEVLSEDDLFSGKPHASAIDYGMVKRFLSVQAWAYNKQYGLNANFLILTNMYGEGDNFNPESSHVVGALIRRFTEAVIENKDEVEVWGSGKPTRNFLYVKDAAQGVIRATALYDSHEPINITTGQGNSIKELAETIAEVTGFRGRLKWLTEKPDGQMKKVLDVSRMKEHLNWQPEFTLKQGLGNTANWYKANKEVADAKKK
ncbi:MAG: epimerase [Parcubacteria group bacterium]|nr:epimerase [Parcubacteria group bacterium]